MPAIREQRGTAAALTATNPVLPDGVLVVETDTGGVKIGDGATAWNSLPYAMVRRGNRGDITVSADGTTWTINAGAVVTADIADGAVTRAKLAATAIAHPRQSRKRAYVKYTLTISNCGSHYNAKYIS